MLRQDVVSLSEEQGMRVMCDEMLQSCSTPAELMDGDRCLREMINE